MTGDRTSQQPHELRVAVERISASLPSEPGLLVAALRQRPDTDYVITVVRGGLEELAYRGYGLATLMRLLPRIES